MCDIGCGMARLSLITKEEQKRGLRTFSHLLPLAWIVDQPCRRTTTSLQEFSIRCARDMFGLSHAFSTLPIDILSFTAQGPSHVPPQTQMAIGCRSQCLADIAVQKRGERTVPRVWAASNGQEGSEQHPRRRRRTVSPSILGVGAGMKSLAPTRGQATRGANARRSKGLGSDPSVVVSCSTSAPQKSRG